MTAHSHGRTEPAPVPRRPAQPLASLFLPLSSHNAGQEEVPRASCLSRAPCGDRGSCFSLCLWKDPLPGVRAGPGKVGRGWRESETSMLLRHLGVLSLGIPSRVGVFCLFFQPNKINSIALPSLIVTAIEKSEVYLRM